MANQNDDKEFFEALKNLADVVDMIVYFPLKEGPKDQKDYFLLKEKAKECLKELHMKVNTEARMEIAAEVLLLINKILKL